MQDNLNLVGSKKAAKQEPNARAGTLSDDELYGDISVLNLAEYCTTCASLGVAIPMLTVRADLQELLEGSRPGVG